MLTLKGRQSWADVMQVVVCGSSIDYDQYEQFLWWKLLKGCPYLNHDIEEKHLIATEIVQRDDNRRFRWRVDDSISAAALTPDEDIIVIVQLYSFNVVYDKLCGAVLWDHNDWLDSQIF